MTTRQDDKAYLTFPHHSLDAYSVAMEALVKADEIAKRLPRGYGPLSDQLRRASQSAFLQLAEGAARSGADRAQRLRCARAKACEAAACVEALGRLGLATEVEVAGADGVAGAVGGDGGAAGAVRGAEGPYAPAMFALAQLPAITERVFRLAVAGRTIWWSRRRVRRFRRGAGGSLLGLDVFLRLWLRFQDALAAGCADARRDFRA